MKTFRLHFQLVLTFQNLKKKKKNLLMFEKFGVFVAATQLNAFIQKEAKFVRIHCMLIQQSGLFR